MHQQNKRITPESWDTAGVLFDVKMAPLPGAVIVCMYPPRTQTEGGILLEGQEAAEGSKYQPDYGVVRSVGKGVNLEPGTVVMVRPYDGAWFGHRDYAWIPEGRQMRMYGRGIGGDAWDDSIEAVVE
jgi:co-chaperonin GroES (HSP10)